MSIQKRLGFLCTEVDEVHPSRSTIAVNGDYTSTWDYHGATATTNHACSSLKAASSFQVFVMVQVMLRILPCLRMPSSVNTNAIDSVHLAISSSRATTVHKLLRATPSGLDVRGHSPGSTHPYARPSCAVDLDACTILSPLIVDHTAMCLTTDMIWSHTLASPIDRPVELPWQICSSSRETRLTLDILSGST